MTDETIVQKLTAIINLLNEIEIKGFYNIKNLGVAIQQLDSMAGAINLRIKAINEKNKIINEGMGPEEE